ncbi:MAG: hypothetical protein ACOVQM_08760 [Pirellula sp.]
MKAKSTTVRNDSFSARFSKHLRLIVCCLFLLWIATWGPHAIAQTSGDSARLPSQTAFLRSVMREEVSKQTLIANRRELEALIAVADQESVENQSASAILAYLDGAFQKGAAGFASVFERTQNREALAWQVRCQLAFGDQDGLTQILDTYAQLPGYENLRFLQLLHMLQSNKDLDVVNALKSYPSPSRFDLVLASLYFKLKNFADCDELLTDLSLREAYIPFGFEIPSLVMHSHCAFELDRRSDGFALALRALSLDAENEPAIRAYLGRISEDEFLDSLKELRRKFPNSKRIALFALVAESNEPKFFERCNLIELDQQLERLGVNAEIDDFRVLLLQAKIRARLGDLDNALLYLNKSREKCTESAVHIRWDEESVSVYEQACVCHRTQRKFVQLHRVAKAFVDSAPNNSNSHFFLGIAQRKCGKRNEAKESLKNSLSQKSTLAAQFELLDLLAESEHSVDWEEGYKLSDEFKGKSVKRSSTFTAMKSLFARKMGKVNEADQLMEHAKKSISSEVEKTAINSIEIRVSSNNGSTNKFR